MAKSFGKSLYFFYLLYTEVQYEIKSHAFSDESDHLVNGYWSYDTAVQRVFERGRLNMSGVV